MLYLYLVAHVWVMLLLVVDADPYSVAPGAAGHTVTTVPAGAGTRQLTETGQAASTITSYQVLLQ